MDLPILVVAQGSGHFSLGSDSRDDVCVMGGSVAAHNTDASLSGLRGFKYQAAVAVDGHQLPVT